MKFKKERQQERKEVLASYVSKRILNEPYQQYNPQRIRSMATVESSHRFTIMIDASGSSYLGNPHFIYHRSQAYNRKTPIIGFSLEKSEVIIPDTSRILSVSHYDLELIEEFLQRRLKRYLGNSAWKGVLWEWNNECKNLRFGPEEEILYEDRMEAFFDGYYDSRPEAILSMRNRFVPSNLPQPDYTRIQSKYVRSSFNEGEEP